MKFKSALITGGTGFIGAHLAKALHQQGCKVGVITRASSSLDLVSSDTTPINIFRYDGNTASIRHALTEQKPDIVFHLASLFLAAHNENDIAPLISSNILFATQILDAMASTGHRHLINTGSSWQHYNNADYDPVCLYAATKQAFEMMLQYYVNINKIRCITLKLFDTYGPDDPRKKLIPLLLNLINTPQRMPMSAGEQLIDIVHIDDVINAYITSANRLIEHKNINSESFGISSGKPIRLRDLVAELECISNTQLDIGWGEREYRDREVMIPWNNYKSLPQWKPVISLEQGLADLVARQHQKPR